MPECALTEQPLPPRTAEGGPSGAPPVAALATAFMWQRTAVSRGFVLLIAAQLFVALTLGLLGSALYRWGSTPEYRIILILVLATFVGLSCVLAARLWRWFQQQSKSGELLHRAFHDTCTGIPNRAAVEVTLEEWLEKDHTVGCLFLEVDGMCSIEHAADETGVEVPARSVVSRLQACLSPQHLLASFGANRFVILVNTPRNRADLAVIAKDVITAMAEPFTVAKEPFTAGVSIGIASFPTDASDLQTLLAAAKNAMTAARNQEPNHFCFADLVCAVADRRNSVLSGKLQRALRDGVLQLVYQPIYGKDHQIVALEALARWRDLEEGPISPDEFVPAAEAGGMIGPLSNWVLRQACTQMAEWLARGFPMERIAVNVSVKQVWRSDFVTTVQRILQETGLSPMNLELELTEGALATDFERVKENLQALRNLGVRISIDDFGVGYSSLSRVQELNADVLKIDRVFVHGANASPSGAAMVQAIIDMAHSLNLSVIAEGVETRDQLELLRGMSCDEIQGFFLSRPQTAEALTAEMLSGQSPALNERHMRLVPRVA